MEYLTAKQILLIHSIIVNETGGLYGVRDRHVILALETSPRQKVFGKELHPTIFHKAALYARNIISFHPFVDGNKRTGMTAAFVFLENNGYKTAAEKGDIKKMALRIIKKRLEIADIAAWFKRHSRKIRN